MVRSLQLGDRLALLVFEPFMNHKTSTQASARKVLLFSGHMIDALGRVTPRFPAEKEAIAAHAIARELQRLDAGPQDLAVCGAACGGDLLFAEAALARGTRLELYIPLEEPAFLRASVDFAGADWHARYLAAKARATLYVMPMDLGPPPEGQDPYERNNCWMLKAAQRYGKQKVECICLWNGRSGDGPGGLHHVIQEVLQGGGRAHWLDVTTLWY